MARPTALERKTAELAAATDELIEERARVDRLQGEVARMRDDRDRWRDARLSDPEADALAGCLRAFEQMHEQERAKAAGAAATFANVSSPRWNYATLPPSPLEHPVGRVLLHIAARYGIALEAKIPEPIPEPGRALVSMPPRLAEAFERMSDAEVEAWGR